MKRRVGVRFGIGLALSLALAARVAPPTVAQQFGPWGSFQGLVGIEYRVEANGPTDVCADSPTEYLVKIMKIGVYDNGSNLIYKPWGAVSGTITIATGKGPITGHSGPLGAQVTLTFDKGTTTVTVTASGVITLPGSTVQTSVDPATFSVTATNCEFDIETVSIWYHLAEGFKPWVGGLTDSRRLSPTVAGGPVSDVVPLKTFAIAGTTSGCTPTFKVEDVNAAITVALRTADILDYYIGYDPGTATTAVDCGSVTSQPRTDKFTLDPISGAVRVGPICVLWCLLQVNGPTVSKRAHILHQTSDAPGITYVIVSEP